VKLLPGIVAACFAAPLFAQTKEPVPAPPLVLQRAAGEIRMDGDLSDPGWKGAAALETFYETSPADNTPPKVQTVALITYDDRFFYIGLRCLDPEPGKIRAPYVWSASLVSQ
jgi:hypothetical protein